MIKRPKSARILQNPTRPIQIDRDRSIAGLLEKMEGSSFQARNLARAHQVWLGMLGDSCTIMLGLSGSLVAGGLRRMIAYLIKNHMVDVIVATGTNIFQDLHETLGRFHYLGSASVNDVELQEHKINRIHDTFASEVEMKEATEWVENFANTLDQTRAYSTREFLYLLGHELSEIASEDGILTSAFKSKVPVYCPSIGDSPLGLSIAAGRINRKSQFQFDVVQDVIEVAQIAAKSTATAGIFFGGGSPKGFIQQTESTSQLIKPSVRGLKYAIQVISEPPYWGDISGSTFEEGQSSGQVSREARTATVHCDCTIAVPLLVNALSQTAGKVLKQRRKPSFTMAREVGITTS